MTTLTIPTTTGPTDEQRATYGFRISLALAMMVMAVVLYYTFVLPLTELAYLGSIVAIAAMVSALLCFRRQTALGIGTLAVGVMVATVAQSILQPGYGFSTGVTQVVVLYGLALFTLPSRLANRILIGAAVVWITCTLFDVFGPPSNAVLDPIDRWTNIALVIIFVAIFGLLIASRYSSFSLRTKLIVVFVAIAVIAVGGIAVVSSQVIQFELSTGIENNLNSVARVTGRSAIENLEKRVFTLQTFALNAALVDELEQANMLNAGDVSRLLGLNQEWRAAGDDDPLVTGLLDNALSNQLDNYRNSFPDNANLLLTDRYGVLAAATYRPEAYIQTDEAWWQAAYNSGQGGVYISQPLTDANDELGLIIATPVRSENGNEVIGVLNTFVRLDAFADVLNASRFGDTGRAEIYIPGGKELELELHDGEMEVELETAPADILGALNNEGTFLNTMHEGVPTVVGVWDLEAGGENANSMAAVNGLGWQVVALQDRAEAFESVIIAERITLLVSLGMLAVVIGLAILIAQALARPIISLTQVAERVRAGDLSATASISSNDEIGTLAATFNDMTAQLRGVLTGLEDRVADRTRALATSAEVSHRLSTILDQRQLVNEVVDQLHEAFNYYHVQVYIFDAKRENLMMVGGMGEAGQTMLERGHKIAQGRGLVGRAAATNSPVLVPDVTKEPTWLPNPLLPETKSEVAVPIAIGDVVTGVLDVQQNTVGGLAQDDAELIQSIANQVAIALQNIRAYTAAQHQADREALINTINQKIQSTSNVENALQVAAREIGRALGTPRVRVRLAANSPHNRKGI